MLNRELAKLCKWFAVNKLSLNLSKTSYMLLRNRPPDVDFNVFIENERINRGHVTTFLGICIDDKLNWKHHIYTVRSKLSKVAAIIYRASCLINQGAIYMLYCSLFLPYINYCSEIWGNFLCQKWWRVSYNSVHLMHYTILLAIFVVFCCCILV